MLNAKTICMRLPGSLQGLRDMVNYINTLSPVNKMKMVEIGTFKGDSTKIFCESFKKVTTIDPWENGLGDITNECNMDEVFELAKENLCKCMNLVILKAKAQEVINTFNRKTLDFVYIDSTHTYEDTCKEIETWLLKLRPGGFMGGHDYSKKFPGVVKAVDRFFKSKGIPVKFFKDSSWLIQIKKEDKEEKENEGTDDKGVL